MVHLKIPVDIEIILEAAVSKFIQSKDTHKLIVHVNKDNLDSRYHNDYFKVKSEIADVFKRKFGVGKQSVSDHHHIPYVSIQVDRREAKRIMKEILDPQKKFGANLIRDDYLKGVYNVRPSKVRYIPEAITPYMSRPRQPSRAEKLAIKLEGLFNLVQMGAMTAHEKGYTGIGVNVAVMDTGIRYNHQEIAGRMNPDKLGYDFVEHTNDPLDKNNPHYHGTHVSGTVAGMNTGVAPGANLFGVRVLDASGFGYESDIIDAFLWCVDNDIHVINCSFGSQDGSDVEESTLDIVINRAGIGVCAAAGNDGGRFISYPKGYGFPGLIGVAAINRDNSWADFSNIHDTNDVSCYGTNILSCSGDSDYIFLDGTSMATPHITGLYALILSYMGNAKPSAVESVIKKTAQYIGEWDYFGAGLGRADTFYGNSRQKIGKQQRIIEEILGGR